MKTHAKSVTVTNKLGLHARPASLIVKTSAGFKSEIELDNQDGYRANGKSIISVMGLEAAKGSVVEVIAKGADAKTAVGAIVQLFKDNFYED